MKFFDDTDDPITTDEVTSAMEKIAKKKPNALKREIRKVMDERDDRFPRGHSRRDNDPFPHQNQVPQSGSSGSTIRIPKSAAPMGYASIGIVIAAVVGWNAGNKALRDEIQNELRVPKSERRELYRRVEKLEDQVDTLRDTLK